jgi:hypothetical protein
MEALIMRTNVHSFNPSAVAQLANIVSEIAAEKAAGGIYIDERAREFIAACVVSYAATGETDPVKIKAHALDSAV